MKKITPSPTQSTALKYTASVRASLSDRVAALQAEIAQCDTDIQAVAKEAITAGGESFDDCDWRNSDGSYTMLLGEPKKKETDDDARAKPSVDNDRIHSGRRKR